jgi:putative ABC transport system permease protein
VTPQRNELSLNYGGIALGGVSVQASELRQSDLPLIATIPNARNIAAVAPKVLGTVNVAGQTALLMGVDATIEFDLKKWWHLDGTPLVSAQDLVAGSRAASTLGLAVGSTVNVQGTEFMVSGILQPTGSQDDDLLLVGLAPAQQLLHKEGIVSFVEVAALCGDCPVSDMVNQISTVLPGAQVSAIQQVVQSRMHALEQFESFSLVVSLLVLFVGSLVVFVTMMGSVNERCHEIGIFRALGFRKKHIVRLILTESILVSCIAGLAGFATGLGAAWLLLPRLTDSGHGAHIIFDPFLAGSAVLMAIVVGCLAALYPALHASRLDPADALRTL